jgi:RNA polymerase sigma-70 factor (ECF subfamily)
MNQDDKELIKNALRGDREAINEVVDRYSPFTYRIVSRVVRNSDDAADITQDVLLKMVSSITELKYVDKFNGWLYRIAYRTSLNWLRTLRKIPFVEIEEIDQLSDDAPLADSELLKRENITHLTKALKSLPDRYSLIIKLFYFEDYSCKEIAELMAMSEGTVRVQLHRARELIRNEIFN